MRFRGYKNVYVATELRVQWGIKPNVTGVIKEVFAGWYGNNRGWAGLKGWVGRRSGKVLQSMGPMKRRKYILGTGKGMQDDHKIRNFVLYSGNF